MIIDSKSGLRGVLVNLDTGARVPFAYWANLDTGEYKAFLADEEGRFMLKGPDGRAVSITGFARLKFIPRQPASPRPRMLTHDQRKDGAAQYRDLFNHVWEARGLARRLISQRWDERWALKFRKQLEGRR